MKQRNLKYIVTLSEDAQDEMAGPFESHEKVTKVFGDSGNWYTNGETGPAWHTLHVCFIEKDTDTVKAHIEHCLSEAGYSGSLFLERDYS